MNKWEWAPDAKVQEKKEGGSGARRKEGERKTKSGVGRESGAQLSQ